MSQGTRVKMTAVSPKRSL